MTRITATQKQIMQAHIEAQQNNSFDMDSSGTKEQLIQALRDGKTVKQVHLYILDNYVSITSLLMLSPNVFSHMSGAAKAGISKGYKTILNSLSIK